MKSFHYPSSVNSHHSLIECLLGAWCWVPWWGVRGDEGRKTQVAERKHRYMTQKHMEGRSSWMKVKGEVFLDMLSYRLKKRET